MKIRVKSGYGYWDITNFPYGGSFYRFKDNTIDAVEYKPYPAKPNEFQIKLESGRTIVVGRDAILDDLDESHEKTFAEFKKSLGEDVDIAQKKRVVIDMDEAEHGVSRMEIQQRYTQLEKSGMSPRNIEAQLKNEFHLDSLLVNEKGIVVDYTVKYNYKGQFNEDATDDMNRAKKELDNKKVEFQKKNDDEMSRAKDREFTEKQKEQKNEFEKKQRENKSDKEQKYREAETKRTEAERKKESKKVTEQVKTFKSFQLKEEVTLTFTKKFISGNLEGLTYPEKMTFIDKERALEYLKNISAKKGLDYIVVPGTSKIN